MNTTPSLRLDAAFPTHSLRYSRFLTKVPMLSACSRPLQAGLLIGFVEGGENLDCGLGCRLGLFPFLVDFVWGAVSDCGLKPGLIAVGVQSMMLRPWGLFTGFLNFPKWRFVSRECGDGLPDLRQFKVSRHKESQEKDKPLP